ncbi:aminoacyl-tRNA hydrolase [Chitinophaga sancti]|uniref:Peptidyl-tRNA hydrolase n=1 Tax=Chitinophaga sancti TaxID=1004 RepID=A0A1K1Q9T1_9BACT|nr:aminoacyl-tRNA hydrolase [Chitinophaga sancti]WQD61217.1 aminoacyl-tRNA hydrolase [Chitinophaga sancti]WQG86656.1 aminoacyl-tRNA hydrolase [Chitinophaga sancti]SFW55942.1 peptidyl-tRNA hydrolase, PTH1 family [Chitinophaga sancti]
MKYLIVGLGNIGAEYEHTRHNIGFDIADTFVAKHGGTYKNERLADVAEVKWKGRTLIVIKPTTYMNLSGKAVKYWMDKEKVPLENIFVLVDDLALPVEVLRIRPGGSDAGQNGLKNIQELLGTNQYPRLRFGIGNSYPKGRQVDFVLGKWPKDELPVVQWKLEKCVEIIEGFVTIGLERTMNQYNNLKYSPGN